MTNPTSPPLYSGATPAQVAVDLAELVDFQPDGIPAPELETMISTRLLPHLMRYDQPVFQSMFNAVPPEAAKIGAQVMLDNNEGVTHRGGATPEVKPALSTSSSGMPASPPSSTGPPQRTSSNTAP